MAHMQPDRPPAMDRLIAALGLTDAQVAQALAAARDLLADPQVRAQITDALTSLDYEEMREGLPPP